GPIRTDCRGRRRRCRHRNLHLSRTARRSDRSGLRQLLRDAFRCGREVQRVHRVLPQASVTVRAVRLHPPGRIEDLALEEIQLPEPHPGEVLVQVHAAAITRDELEWPTDRLPAIPSYELSGVVAEDAGELLAGTEVFGLTPFARPGVAAAYAVVPTEVLAAKPTSLSHVQAAALPMAGLSAWQALVVHGRLQPDERGGLTGGHGRGGHLGGGL